MGRRPVAGPAMTARPPDAAARPTAPGRDRAPRGAAHGRGGVLRGCARHAPAPDAPPSAIVLAGAGQPTGRDRAQAPVADIPPHHAPVRRNRAVTPTGTDILFLIDGAMPLPGCAGRIAAAPARDGMPAMGGTGAGTHDARRPAGSRSPGPAEGRRDPQSRPAAGVQPPRRRKTMTAPRSGANRQNFPEAMP